MPEIWRIYHVQNCQHSTPPKNKYVAIVCKDVKPMGFLINKGIHKFIQKRPHLLVCQAPIEKSNHKCLSRDSYVNCVKLFEFDDMELVEKRDPISDRARIQIREAVSKSKTIEERYKKLILGEA